MTYSRRVTAQEAEEVSRKAQQITAICEQLGITLDPIDWQQAGMQTCVMVNQVEIANLLELSRQDSDSILRQMRIKLFEHAARKTIRAQSVPRASIWSPVEVIQPQSFLSLWVITMETDERIPIIESLKNGRRVYEPYLLKGDAEQQFEALFGPLQTGEYALGTTVTVEERERKYTGEIIYILPPSKILVSRKNPGRGYHTIAGKTYTNDTSSRYLVECHDGFPHIINQAQIVSA